MMDRGFCHPWVVGLRQISLLGTIHKRQHISMLHQQVCPSQQHKCSVSADPAGRAQILLSILLCPLNVLFLSLKPFYILAVNAHSYDPQSPLGVVGVIYKPPYLTEPGWTGHIFLKVCKCLFEVGMVKITQYEIWCIRFLYYIKVFCLVVAFTFGWMHTVVIKSREKPVGQDKDATIQTRVLGQSQSYGTVSPTHHGLPFSLQLFDPDKMAFI